MPSFDQQSYICFLNKISKSWWHQRLEVRAKRFFSFFLSDDIKAGVNAIMYRCAHDRTRTLSHKCVRTLLAIHWRRVMCNTKTAAQNPVLRLNILCEWMRVVVCAYVRVCMCVCVCVCDIHCEGYNPMFTALFFNTSNQ